MAPEDVTTKKPMLDEKTPWTPDFARIDPSSRALAFAKLL